MITNFLPIVISLRCLTQAWRLVLLYLSSHSFTKMHFSTLLILSATLAKDALAGYVLQDDYMEAGFFDQFDFWHAEDPTHGFVQYQDQSSAESMGLISSTSGNIKMSVDSTNQTPNGRPSVRIESKKSYNYGLIVADIEHMPGGICGAW